jgi:hypothetical protein
MPTATLSQAVLTADSLPANYFLENFALRADKPALITTVASFPANYFLENLALRADNSALVTAMNQKELWYVPPAAVADTATPTLLHTFEQLTFNLNEVEPDVFYLVTSNVYTNHESSLHRIDLRKWSPGEAIQPQKILDFPKEAGFLNGGCLIGPRKIVVADSVGLIWRVDLPNDGGAPSARVWLRHESMGNYPGQMKPEQPGINGYTVRREARLCLLHRMCQEAVHACEGQPGDPGRSGRARARCGGAHVRRFLHRRERRRCLFDDTPRKHHRLRFSESC